jgi:hypothetical protein
VLASGGTTGLAAIAANALLLAWQRQQWVLAAIHAFSSPRHNL